MAIARNSAARGHPSYLREAIASLLDNAIRHAPADGRIVVSCGSGAVVTIDDEGPGIPAEQLARLVEPFNVGSSPRPGAGLGLPLAKRIAELHGGELRIERSPLGGARAILNLPAVAACTKGQP